MNQHDIFNLVAKGARMTQVNYQKTSQFFINSINYVRYVDQMKIKDIDFGIVTSINLQCTGNGSFYPQKIAARFLQNLQQLTNYNPQIKRIKIKLSGFDLSKELDVKFTTRSKKSERQKRPTLVEGLTELIHEKVPLLTSLQIRISNVKNCRFEDFKSIMELGVNIQAKQLVNLSCEFSDWTFPKMRDDKVGEQIYKSNKELFKRQDHDRNDQPNMQIFLKILQESFERTCKQPMLSLRKFRLEISTWYYSDFEVQKFFNKVQLKGIQKLPKQDKIPQRIQYFHNEFKNRVEVLIRQLMPELTNMEIDLRNWNKKFEMSILKAAILNISSERKNSFSQISKKLSHNQKKIITNVLSNIQKSAIIEKTGTYRKTQTKEVIQQEDEEEKERFFDLLVII